MKSNIRKLRNERQITQETLAKAIGKTQQAVSQMEQDRDHISIESLLAMADYFDVSTDYILGRNDNRNTDADDKYKSDTYLIRKETENLRKILESDDDQLLYELILSLLVCALKQKETNGKTSGPTQ